MGGRGVETHRSSERAYIIRMLHILYYSIKILILDGVSRFFGRSVHGTIVPCEYFFLFYFVRGKCD